MSAISSVGANTIQSLGSQNASDTQQVHRHHRHGGGPKEFNNALESLGIDSTKADDIQKQIDAAIKTAQQNSSGGDPRSSIRDAVDGVLKQNGIDPAKLQDALKAQRQNAQQQAPAGAPEQFGDLPTPTSLTTSGAIDTTA